MDLIPLHKRVVALDVHQAVITTCAIIADDNGVRIEERSFETFKRGLRALADWCLQIAPEVVVMESTGIYWKSPHAWLERAGLKCIVVNAHHVKNVPGRKTDVKDCEWIAQLLQHGLLRGSFIPDRPLRDLRDLTRQRVQLLAERTAVVNRIQKVLEDANIKLASTISYASLRAIIILVRPLHYFPRHFAIDTLRVPASNVLGGTSSRTTTEAPTTEPAPTVTPGRIVQREPIQAPASTRTGFGSESCPRRRGSSRLRERVRNITWWPMAT